MVNANDKHRLAKIEDRLSAARHVLEAMLPLHSQVDRKVRSLKDEIDRLEEERMKLQQGQLSMSFDELNF